MRRLPGEARALIWNIGAPLAELASGDQGPDWEQSSVRWIESAYRRARALPTGGWYALCASRELRAAPRRFVVAGREFVVWRHGQALFAAPNACPHLGAPLDQGRVCDGYLVCPWHGLALGPAGHRRWRPLRTHDDGVLFWVRLDDDGEETSERPILPVRPPRFLDSVLRVEAQCDPEDVVRNRLDPWHGAHLHSADFARVRVVAQEADAITVRVAFRVLGPICVEVDASFRCVDRRTLVMTIEAGDGEGSVVETHATPLGRGRTAIVEATLATSERLGFRVARAVSPLLRPLVRRAARRLWRDDAAYAERRATLRVEAIERAQESAREEANRMSARQRSREPS